MTTPEVLFEQSWEVCNKVGGIYTVLTTKAALMKEKYGEGYICIGPYFKENALYELREEEPPKEIKKVFNELANQGLKFYYGKWRIKGEPTAILVDYRNLKGKENEYKTWLWEKYGIDSMFSKSL